MIERVYVHNYRCFENFDLKLSGLGSALVIGKNGSGKSTLRRALGVFQKIGRGPNMVKDWVELSDFTRGWKDTPMRFEVDVILSDKRYQYAISFDVPERFPAARVDAESLTVDGEPVFTRKNSQVDLPGGPTFGMDWHAATLPIITDSRFGRGHIERLKSFFASMVLVAPVPSLMSGFSEENEDELDEHATNLAGWMNDLLKRRPAAYPVIDKYLKDVIPDFEALENAPRGEVGTQLTVRFRRPKSDQSLAVDFKKLSDGEKCFFLSAVILAYNQLSGPLFCLWDEPDNHLTLPEVGHFVVALRRMANAGGQFVATSHHPEAIRRFSNENTLVFTRNSHLEPTLVRPLSEYPVPGDLINALLRGEVIE